MCGTYHEEVSNDCIYQDTETSAYFNVKIYMKMSQVCYMI